MSALRQDLRYAARSMLLRPGFSGVVLATLALGIGANAAIFSVVDAVLLRRLPFPAVDRVVQLTHNDTYGTVSEPEFVDYQRGMSALSALAAWAGGSAIIGVPTAPVRAPGARVSRDFFRILGVPAEVGRTFAADEFSHLASERVTVISHALWQQQFAGDRAVVGRAVDLNGVRTTIVGVMPAGFDFPNPQAAFWTPWRMNPDSLWTRNNHYLQLIGRLAPGATVAQASSQTRSLEAQWMHDYPETYFPSKPLIGMVTPLRERLLGATRPYLLALMGAVGFILLIACVNVANLLLARGESRRKELAVRSALGASEGQLVRQLLTESALLAGCGAFVGIGLAGLGVRLLVSLAPRDLPRIDSAGVDYRVVLFTAATAILTGLLFGLAPALRARRQHAAEVLRDGGRDSALGLSGSARQSLVIAEIALAVIMLFGSGLLIRSLLKLRQIELGFDPTRVLTMQLDLPVNGYTDTTADQAFSQIVSRVRALRGVDGAALDGALPIAGSDNGWSIMRDGRIAKTISEADVARPEQVTPDYFRTMAIPVRRGRGFTNADRMGAPPVAVISETMARTLWPGADPIGHTLKMFSPTSPWVTIVGVAGDVRSRGYQRDIPPTMYFPYSQSATSAYFMPTTMTLVVRANGSPATLTAAVRSIVRAQDPRIPISNIATMDDVVGDSIASRRFTTGLLAGFAVLALLLAGVGIYGVIAYGVSQRTGELGIRMALGASTASVFRLVVSEGARMIVIGLGLGLLGSAAVDRLLRSLLVGVGLVDIPTLAAVSVVLVSVAALACGVPARRATTVSPIEALRAG